MQDNIQAASHVGCKDGKYIPTNDFASAYKPPKFFMVLVSLYFIWDNIMAIKLQPIVRSLLYHVQDGIDASHGRYKFDRVNGKT